MLGGFLSVLGGSEMNCVFLEGCHHTMCLDGRRGLSRSLFTQDDKNGGGSGGVVHHLIPSFHISNCS